MTDDSALLTRRSPLADTIKRSGSSRAMANGFPRSSHTNHLPRRLFFSAERPVIRTDLPRHTIQLAHLSKIISQYQNGMFIWRGAIFHAYFQVGRDVQYAAVIAFLTKGNATKHFFLQL